MTPTPFFRKSLVLGTLFAAFLILFAVMRMHKTPPPPRISMQEAAGNPMLGNPEALLGLLLIEDFHCHACRVFFDEIFPELKAQYLDTGLAYCIYVPIALFPNTKPLANAALAVYHLAPSQFIPFLQKLFEGEAEDLDDEELIVLTEQLGGIDSDRFRDCLRTHRYYGQLDQNFEWAQKIMGQDFGIPALYVNGLPVSTWSLEEIRESVERASKNLR